MEGCEACEAVAAAELEHAQRPRRDGGLPLGDVRRDKRGERPRALPDLQTALVHLVHDVRALCRICVWCGKGHAKAVCWHRDEQEEQTERVCELVGAAAAAARGAAHEREGGARDAHGAKLAARRDTGRTRRSGLCAERHLHSAFLRSCLFVFPFFLHHFLFCFSCFFVFFTLSDGLTLFFFFLFLRFSFFLSQSAHRNTQQNTDQRWDRACRV